MREKIKEILKTIGLIILFLLVIDLLILVISLSQVVIEGRTGYWSPFWLWQARFLVRLLYLKRLF
jgi:hypothetical protein